MKKKLVESGIVNELIGSSSFFQSKDKGESVRVSEIGHQSEKAKPVGEESTVQSTRPPTSQSTAQSTTQSTDHLTDQSALLGRPRAFYITEQQDEELNVAVDKLTKRVRGKVNERIDRSIILRLLLEVTKITNDEMIDKLASQLIARLISQLTS